MSVSLVVGVIILGLLLIMVEVFLIPGTTVVGVVGGIVVVAGVYMAYSDHGVKVGNIALASSVVATGILLYAGFKAYSSKKFSLNDIVEGKVNVFKEELAKKGDEGVTISYLRPNGKALINNNKIEVYSLGEFIKSGVKVKVTKVTESKIYVKPINEV